ncbi:MAG: hypothetical protein ACOYCB_03180 [Fastidiosipilaceae bacterium]
MELFNDLGFNDRYGQGFPSRWIYTDSKLKAINGTPELDKCLKKTFAVINFISRIDYLDSLIEGINKYLAFDKWKIIRTNENIEFVKLDKIIISPSKYANAMNEGDFLALKFEVSLSKLKLENSIIMVLEYRMREAENCLQYGSYLSCIILTGSIMEGILLGYAMKNPKEFSAATAAPKTKKRRY